MVSWLFYWLFPEEKPYQYVGSGNAKLPTGGSSTAPAKSPDIRVTVWKDGSWKAWRTLDALYARDDPDWLTEIPLAVALADAQQAEASRNPPMKMVKVEW